MARSTASRTSPGVPDSTTRTPRAKPAARVASSMPSKAAAKPYSRVLDVNTVTDWTGPPAKARRGAVGTKAELGDRVEDSLARG